jgi:non-ribosomal peptide synthetase component F
LTTVSQAAVPPAAVPPAADPPAADPPTAVPLAAVPPAAVPPAAIPRTAVPVLTAGPAAGPVPASPAGEPATLPALVRRWSAGGAAVAVRAGEHVLTYQQLDAFSDRLARQLAGLGLPPGSAVGVPGGLDAGLPGILLAVTKAGHYWVPGGGADAAGPVRAIITTPDADESGGSEPAPGSEPDAGGPGASRGTAGSVPVLAVTPRDLSGSGARDSGPGAIDWCQPPGALGAVPAAGQPGPVLVAHAPLTALLQDAGAALGISPGDRILAAAPAGVARGILDILLGLACGAEVILASAAAAGDARLLAELVAACQPDLLHATPAVWHHLLAAGLARTPGLTAVSSGDPLPAALATRLADVADRVWTAHGPAETGGYGLIRPAAPPAADPAGPPGPAGPAGPRAAFVLGEAGLPAPPGQLGELWLADDGVAIGYLGCAASHTAGSYRPDPSGGRPGRRLARTGTAARARGDQDIELRGPAGQWAPGPDGPVHALDAEEAVLRVPGVAQCAAAVRRDQDGVRLLVSFVPAPGWAGSAAELEEAVSLALSGLLVPYRAGAAGRLPLAPDGMIDRQALGAAAPADGPAGGRLADTPEERAIAGLWSQLLGIPEPSAELNFFEAGGYSLAVTRLANLMEQAFGLPVPLAELFVHTTVAAQARLLERLYDERLTGLDVPR